MFGAKQFLETNKESLIKVPYIPNAESLNITLEPKGGSKTPNVSQLYANGKMLYFGKKALLVISSISN